LIRFGTHSLITFSLPTAEHLKVAYAEKDAQIAHFNTALTTVNPGATEESAQQPLHSTEALGAWGLKLSQPPAKNCDQTPLEQKVA
jgi:hypothetical protein